MAKFSRDDDRPEPRRDNGGNTALIVVLLIGGGLLLLACAGVGVGFWFVRAQAVRVEAEMVRAEAEADARRAAEVEAEMEQGKAPPMDREAFKKAVMGKTPDEVIAAVGKPDSASEGGRETYWRYKERTWDPTASKTDSSAQVVFEKGKVTAVNFH